MPNQSLYLEISFFVKSLAKVNNLQGHIYGGFCQYNTFQKLIGVTH